MRWERSWVVFIEEVATSTVGLPDPYLAITAWLLVILSAGGILLVFLAYPLLLRFKSGGVQARPFQDPPAAPSISFVVVARNAEDMIEEKLRNCLSLNYPDHRLEFIFYSDGSTDGTDAILRRYREVSGVRFLSSNRHRGKTAGLNQAMENATGELVVFSDVDALLEPNTLTRLVTYCSDPGVGGSCGQRVIAETPREMGNAQEVYGRFDSTIKSMENRIGSITSSDGKLYSIRRKLFQPIPAAVTDDFYTALSIVAQGYRFVFEPRARAYIRIPSRNARHEVNRRRRIVSRSLRAIYLLRELLNPWKYGVFAIGLAINKVFRRLLPLFLLLLFSSTVALCFFSPLATLLLLPQLAFYAAALAFPLIGPSLSSGSRVKKVIAVAWYFCVGNYGTLHGLVDFLAGRGGALVNRCGKTSGGFLLRDLVDRDSIDIFGALVDVFHQLRCLQPAESLLRHQQHLPDHRLGVFHFLESLGRVRSQPKSGKR